MRKRFARFVSYLLVGVLVMQDGMTVAAVNNGADRAETAAVSEQDIPEPGEELSEYGETTGTSEADNQDSEEKETDNNEQSAETEETDGKEQTTEKETDGKEQPTDTEETDSEQTTETEETETVNETEKIEETGSADETTEETEETVEEEIKKDAEEKETVEINRTPNSRYIGDIETLGENLFPENLFEPGEGEGTFKNWTRYNDSVDSMTSQDDGAGVEIKINANPLGLNWGTGLKYTGPSLNLKAGGTYEISYTIKSTVDRVVDVGFDGNIDTSRDQHSLNANEPTKITYRMTIDNAGNNAFMFFLGNVADKDDYGAHDITISDLYIKEVTVQLEDGDPVDENPDNLLTNGTFADGTTEPWKINDQNASVKTAKYKVVFDMTGGVGDDWTTWLRQDDITFSPTTKYKITFDAYSTIDRYIVAAADGGTWLQHKKLKADETTTVEYQVTGMSGNNFVIALGSNLRASSVYQDWEGNEMPADAARNQTLEPHRVVISNVCITEIPPELPDTPNDTPYTKITNLNGYDGYQPSDLFPLKDGKFSQPVTVKYGAFDASLVKTDWLLWHEEWMGEGVTCTPSEDGVAVYIPITGGSEGNKPWDVQLSQTISLESNTEYVLSFKVKSEKARSINVIISDIESGDPWVKPIAIQKGETREVVLNLPKLTERAIDKTFQIQMGNVSGNVEENTLTITDLKLEVNGYSELAERIADGYFDNGDKGNFSATADGNNAEISFVDKYMKAEIKSACSESDVIVSSGAFDLLGDQEQYEYEYEVSFVAGATENGRAIKAVLEDNSGKRLAERSFVLTIDAEKYSFTYSPQTSPNNVRLKLLLGGSEDTICVDTIRCDLKGYPEAAGLDTKGHDITLLEKKQAPVISEMPADEATTGEDVVISFDKAGNEAYKEAIDSVYVDGTKVDSGMYKIDERTRGNQDEYTITLDASLFTVQGERQTFTIEVRAPWYQNNKLRQTVYKDSRWRSTWLEEFDGDALDESKWSYQLGIGDNNDGWGNNEQQCYTDSSRNIKVGNGELTITARKQKNDSGRPYTSARIWTMNDDGKTAKFAQTYGRMEAKMKLAGGDGYEGVWPAFWMLPVDLHYGVWPLSGEIDILEARGREPLLADGTVHYGKPWPNNESQGGVFDYSQSAYNQDSDINDYHIYAVEWEPGEIRWYVDDELYFTYSNWYSQSSDNPDKFRYPAPFDQDFYIILNLAIGGTFDNSLTPDDNKMPVDMKVDYVRVYESKDGYKEVTEEPPVDRDPDADIDEMKSYLADEKFENINIVAEDGKDLNRNTWNLVTLPSFGGSADFTTVTDDEGQVYAKITPKDLGIAAHAIQLIQHLDLAKGYNYRISFDAWTEGSRKLNMKIGQDGTEGWNTYQTFETSLTDSKQHYTYEFQSGVTDLHSRVEFNLATSNQPIYIGNIKYEVIDEIITNPDAKKKPLENGNCVYNGSFDVGSIDGLSYWHMDNSDGKTVRDGKGYAFTATKGNLYQDGLELLQSDTYELTFSATAESEREIEVIVSDKAGQTIYKCEKIVMTPERGTNKITFTMPAGVTDSNARLCFEFGEGSSRITMTDIWLKRTTYNNVEWEEVNAHPLLNGDFELGKLYWSDYNAGFEVVQDPDNADNHCAKVNAPQGGNKWDALLSYDGLSFTAKTDYEFSFDVKATADNETIRVTMEDSGYYAHYEQKELEVGTELKHYIFDVRFTDNMDGLALKFQTGGANTAHEVYFDNVVIQAKGAPKAPGIITAEKYNRLGTDIVLSYSGESDWVKNAVVYVDDVRVDSDKAVFADGKLTLDKSVFSKSKPYKVIVRSAGYTPSRTLEVVLYPANGDRILNGGFNLGKYGLDYWDQYILAQDNDYITVEDGKAKIHYDGPAYSEWGLASWAIQLFQDNIVVEKDKKYQLSFIAYATKERRIQVIRNQTYTTAGEVSHYMTITTEPQVYEFEFDSTNDYLKIQFLLSTVAKTDGAAITDDDILPAHDIYIDNVCLLEMIDGEAPKADKTALKKLVDECASLVNNMDFYTEDSYNTFLEAYNYAKDILEKEDAKQAETDNAEDNLCKAKVGLEPLINKDNLDVLINECEAITDQEKDYTADSWKNFIDALNAARDVSGIPDASLEMLKKAYDNLSNAKENLIPYTVTTDNLKDLIDVCEALLENEEEYTSDSWKDFIDALNNAKDVAANPNATQEEINAAYQALTEAKNGLKPAETETSKTKEDLENLIQEYESLNLKEEDYSEDSWKDFIDALNHAKDVAANPDAASEKIEKAYKDLEEAKASLTPNETEKPLTKGDLDSLISACETLKEDEYEPESWIPFAQALETAKSVLENSDATQEEIEKAYKDLEEAKSGLRKHGEPEPINKDQLRALISECEALDRNAYEKNSWDIFAKALTDARAVSENESATQEDVQNAVRRLSEALEQLKEREGLWAYDIADVTYTGKTIKPTVTVYNGRTLLTQGKDYTVSYKKNTKVTENAEVIIKGKGNYTGSITKIFEIVPKNLGEADIIIPDLYVMAPKAGKSVTPAPVVTRSGKKLTKKEYSVGNIKDINGITVDKVTEPGTYTVAVNGIEANGYTGTKEIQMTVLSSDQVLMSAAKVTGIKNKEYTGEKIEPEFTVKYGKDTLTPNEDYTIICDSKEIGTATAVIKGSGSKYVGEKTVTFKITGTVLKAKDVTLENAANAVYTGKAIEPVVKIAGAEQNRDFIVTYDKNDKAGTAAVIVKGIGKYTGTVKKTFKIAAFDIKENRGGKLSYNTAITVPYMKGGSKLTAEDLKAAFDGNSLTEGIDYTLIYTANKKVGTASVKIKGKGNFKGTTAPVSFTIEEQNIANLTDISAADVLKKNARKYSSVSPVIKDFDGKALKKGTDFTIAAYTGEDGITPIDGIPNVGDTIRVTVKGENNYTGMTYADFRVIEDNRNISKATVKIAPQSYTGKEITLTEKDPMTGEQLIEVTMKIDGSVVTLTEGTDYEIVKTGYSKNINKGTAKMMIRGIHDYGGTKSVSFKIVAHDIDSVAWYDSLYSRTMSWFRETFNR